MRHPTSLVASALTVDLCLLAACGADELGERSATLTTEHGRTSITVPLAAENGSRSSGVAVLRGDDRGFVVTLAVKPDQRSYAAHIHNVSCGVYRTIADFDAELDTVVATLADLRRGRSRSVVHRPVLKYARGRYSIIVHHYEPPYPAVACGDLDAG